MSINFHIPDFFGHWQLNLNLLELKSEHPEYFNDGVNIASCYGCFPNAMWNGGRAVAGNITNKEAQAIMLAFNSYNVPIRFTFTNPILKRIHLGDMQSNNYAKMAENGFNEVIVNTPVIEEYIRRKYPAYPIISSTVKQIRDIDALKEELAKDYKYVVLDYNWNNDFELLEKIPMEDRKRCEILINAYCIPSCQRRGEHYQVLGNFQVDMCLNKHNPEKTKPIDFKCSCSNDNFYFIHKYSTFISNDTLYSKYVEMGFENFKIEGRTINAFNVLESYMYYLIKPEFRDKVRLEMIMKPSYHIDELIKKHVDKD